MAKYFIETNGIKYRVRVKRHWWTPIVTETKNMNPQFQWYPDAFPPYFDTLQEARKYLNDIIPKKEKTWEIVEHYEHT